jgi:hypothetical protein
MKAAKNRNRVSAPFRDGDLLEFELQIARRADTLWRISGYCSGRDLIHWLQAESEVLERRLMGEEPSSEMVTAGR